MDGLNFPNPALEYPVTIEDGTRHGMKVLAVAGNYNDWAAYVGPTDKSDAHVVQWGLKLDQATAEALFYDMAHSGREWRR
ncbi:MAG: hypothetical protein KAX80_05530 [Planctomycetes bacterium]|nr:hypothetical protein [Planctomycetota bacterium]